MESEHIIDEQVTIKDADIEDVYDDCIEWLRMKRSIIIQENRPHFVEASHVGSRPDHEEVYEDFAKHIRITITPTEDAVQIHIIMDELEKNPRVVGYENRRRVWSGLVEELWKHIGVEIDNEVLKQLYSLSKIKERIKEHRKNITYILGIFVVGLIFFEYVSLQVLNSPFLYLVYRTNREIYFLIHGIPLGREVLRLFKWRKRLTELYPYRDVL